MDDGGKGGEGREGEEDGHGRERGGGVQKVRRRR